MKFDKLVAAVANTVVDEQKIKSFECRIKEADKKFERDAQQRMVKKDFLSHAYSL